MARSRKNDSKTKIGGGVIAGRAPGTLNQLTRAGLPVKQRFELKSSRWLIRLKELIDAGAIFARVTQKLAASAPLRCGSPRRSACVSHALG